MSLLNEDASLHGEIMMGNWKRESILGSGGFGMVSLWRNVNTDEKIALKQCRWGNESGLSAKHKERWKQEVDIMHRLDHESVVKALKLPDGLNKIKSDLPILAMEYCSGGDLRKVLNKPENCCGVPEEQLTQILKQIASAIEYLHLSRIIHRDLKPENVVLQPQSDGRILYKLIDLGYAKELDQSSLASSFVGTLQYLAPELFLSKQYTSSVDNWSFGLLTVELITGRRPFVPHMSSPAQWIPIVSKKSSSDISAFLESNGNVKFSKELIGLNQICGALKFKIEDWLRIVLEWDSKQRGGKTAFQTMKDILKKYIVHVFVINSLEIHSYEVSHETSLMDLKLLIHSNTGIDCDNQYIILPRGITANEEVGKQIILTFFDNEDGKEAKEPHSVSLFVFDMKSVADFNPYLALIFPPTVEQIMLNPTQLIGFEEQKSCWQDSVWLAQQAIKKYRYLHESLKMVLMNCLNLQAAMQRASTKLNVEFNKLLAVSQFFRNSIKFNIEQCEKQKLSPSLLRSSKEAMEKLKEIHGMQDNVGMMFNAGQSMSTKLIELQRDPQISSLIKLKHIDDSLSQIYASILSAYDILRRKPKEERSKKANNTQMVKLLCDCFQMQEKLMRNIFSHLRKLIELNSQIESHQKEINNVLVTVLESQNKLNIFQHKIQTDFWNYFKDIPKQDSLSSSPSDSLNSHCNGTDNSFVIVSNDHLVNESDSLIKTIDSNVADISLNEKTGDIL